MNIINFREYIYSLLLSFWERNLQAEEISNFQIYPHKIFKFMLKWIEGGERTGQDEWKKRKKSSSPHILIASQT